MPAQVLLLSAIFAWELGVHLVRVHGALPTFPDAERAEAPMVHPPLPPPPAALAVSPWAGQRRQPEPAVPTPSGSMGRRGLTTTR